MNAEKTHAYTEPVPLEMLGVTSDVLLEHGIEQAEKDLHRATQGHPNHVPVVESYLAAAKAEFEKRGLVRRRVYALDEKTNEDLRNRFTYHAPKPDQLPRYESLRSQAFALACEISTKTPKSREQSLALTHLETAIFFANAAIARNE